MAKTYSNEYKKEVLDYFNQHGKDETLEKFGISNYTLQYFRDFFKKNPRQPATKTNALNKSEMISITLPEKVNDNVYIVCCRPEQLASVMRGLNQ